MKKVLIVQSAHHEHAHTCTQSLIFSTYTQPTINHPHAHYIQHLKPVDNVHTHYVMFSTWCSELTHSMWHSSLTLRQSNSARHIQHMHTAKQIKHIFAECQIGECPQFVTIKNYTQHRNFNFEQCKVFIAYDLTCFENNFWSLHFYKKIFCWLLWLIDKVSQHSWLCEQYIYIRLHCWVECFAFSFQYISRD